MNFCQIYKITNTINDKIYIGKTTESLEKRWSRHKECSKTKTSYLYKAMRKYGIDNFIIEPVFTCFNDKHLNSFEISFINSFNSIAPKNGYNLTLGGDGGKFTEERKILHSLACKGRTQTPETIEKIRQANTGKKQSLESISKMVRTRKKLKSFKGFTGKHTEETKMQISKNRKGKKVRQIFHSVKLIDKTTKQEFVFTNIQEAAITLNLSRTAICNAANGWSKSLKNYDVISIEKKRA